MKLNKETKRKLLLLYVRFFHRGQERKFKDEYYYHHLVRVAKMAEKFYPAGVSFEIGLCHDLFEDTSCTPSRLDWFLKLIGYNLTDKARIVMGVLDLTDRYTPGTYPQYNRSERKQREAVRLSQCSPMIQTIKYCDFKDNTTDIINTAPKFAKTYLMEKRYALNLMNCGDKKFRNELIEDTEVYTTLLNNCKY